MKTRLLLAAAAVSGALAHDAHADHWMQTADPQVVQALNELAQVYGSYCQQGNPQACEMVSAIQQHGGQMLNAGYECQINRNPQACNWYQTYYQMLSQTYAQTRQALMQAQMAPPAPAGANPLGDTHEQRMQAIQQWGQERLQWGQQQSQIMDQRHEQFMRTLRD